MCRAAGASTVEAVGHGEISARFAGRAHGKIKRLIGVKVKDVRISKGKWEE